MKASDEIVVTTMEIHVLESMLARVGMGFSEMDSVRVIDILAWAAVRGVATAAVVFRVEVEAVAFHPLEGAAERVKKETTVLG